MKRLMVAFIIILVPTILFAQDTIVYPKETISILPSKSSLYDSVARVTPGTPLRVIGSDYMWFYVETENGKKGYVKKVQITTDPKTGRKEFKLGNAEVEDADKLSNPAYKPVAHRNVSPKYSIDVLDSAGFGGKSIIKAFPGDDLLLIGTKDAWYRVKVDSKEGWVAKSWVTDDYTQIQSLRKKRREQEQTKAAVEKAKKEKEAQKRAEGYHLKLLSWNWRSEHGYAVAQGQVENISKDRLPYLEVVVSWFDKDKNLISYRTTFVEYTSLMPNQVSPFKVIENYNPLMKTAKINFKCKGSIVPWYKD